MTGYGSGDCFSQLLRKGAGRMRRAVGGLLVLLTLCFTLMTRAEPVSDDAEALRSFLQSHYGVMILMGDEISDFPSEEYEIRVIPEGNSVFLQMTEGNSRYLDILRRLDDVFSVYPPEFFSRFAKTYYFDGLRFLLADEILQDGKRIGGVQSVHTGYIDIYLAKEDAKERAIHHEIWHAMDYRIRCDDLRAFEDWALLNPEGFAYTGDFSAIRDEDGKREAEDWFASAYGKIDEYEDRATVFEAMMLKDESWWSTRPRLRKKAEYLLEKAEPVFGEIFAGE